MTANGLSVQSQRSVACLDSSVDCCLAFFRATSEAQTPSSTASAQSWCAGPPVARSRYVDPPSPLKEPDQGNGPKSPSPLSGFRRGVVKTLQTAPQYIMAGAVMAAAAAGFLKAGPSFPPSSYAP
jgi:hypothetical protein